MIDMSYTETPSFFDLTPDELQAWLKERGEPSFAAKQILEWLYRHQVDSIDAMSNVSKKLRATLAERFTLATPTVLETQEDPADGTEKTLFQLGDGECVETVVMPRFSEAETDAQSGNVKGFEKDKVKEYTICVSTQVGCMFACRFCASGQMGYTRDLSAGEIIAQLMAFLHAGKNVTRMVFMGMGEPLHNLAHVKKVIDILSHPKALGWSKRRFTISTVGLVPEIYRMAQEEWKVKLAISLHATTDAKRAELIPMAKVYQLDQLFDALRFYHRRDGRRISLEYLMIDGFNDAKKDAQRLASLCEGMKMHINLIPCNAIPRMDFKPSQPRTIREFRGLLRKEGIDATVRYSRGRHIEGACGQLRLRERAERRS
ncbi:23S rRNA (adenine(2503)-C(2))-methyltransferase RlmN [bacterium]|nr:23S rRNA (adenine(2503)-C(2))-methyltransferase RlmN [bacterium]